MLLPSPLPRLVSTGLLFVAGAFSVPAESASALSPDWFPAPRAVDDLDEDLDRHDSTWDPTRREPAILHGGGSGHVVDGVIPGGRPGLPAVKDPQPAMPTVLPAIPAVMPKRPGSEPLGEGGALTTTVPNGTNGARELRLQMREYGTRQGEPRGAGKAAPRLLRDAGGEGRWLDADERSSFREALRERHHRPRH